MYFIVHAAFVRIKLMMMMTTTTTVSSTQRNTTDYILPVLLKGATPACFVWPAVCYFASVSLCSPSTFIQ